MTPELRSRIEGAVAAITNGWCSVEKAIDLAETILQLKPQVTVEIGVWGGRSLIPMAMAHAEIQQGVVWAIDPWSAQASAEGEIPANARWWGSVDHEPIYQSFLTQIQIFQVEKFVKVMRAKSDDVVPPPVIDFIHIDGNHSDQAVKDVDRFASKVRPGGKVFVDDIGWSTGGVDKAVRLLISMGFVHVAARDTGGMFLRPMPNAPIVVEAAPIPVSPVSKKGPTPETPPPAKKKRAKKVKMEA